jgi:flagellar protein FlaG
MDNKVLEIKPVGLGPSIAPEYRNQQEPQEVRYKAGGEERLPESIGREANAEHDDSASGAGLKQTRELLENVQSYLNDLNIRLGFDIHEQTGELVVKVINRDTGEVIRQIPPKAMLKLHEKVAELRGVLFNEKV